MARISVWIISGLLAATLGFLAREAFTERQTLSLPEPLLVDLEGRGHRLADLKGQFLILNFWATWCQPCREEMKTFSELQARFASQGVQFIGIAIDDPSTVRSYLRDFPVNYPIWVGGADVPAWADSLGNDLSALPFTVVFDRSGAKREVKVGVFAEKPLAQLIESLISKPD